MAMNVKEWTRDYFLSNEPDCNLILQKSDALQEIPCLNSSTLLHFKDGQLVRFRGMVQDMFNPEYFLENYEVKDTRTGESSTRNGLYLDSAKCLSHENISFDSNKNKNAERQVFFVISVPGLNDWAKDKAPYTNAENLERNLSKRSLESNEENAMDCSEPIKKKGKTAESSESTSKAAAQKETAPRIVSKDHILNFPIPNEDGKACIVKVYDSEATLKLNQVLDIVGFISFDPIHPAINDSEELMDDIEVQTHNPPASMVPRLHAIKVIHLAKSEFHSDPNIFSKAELIRGDLQMVLSQLLFGDLLAADYLICHLISSIYIRKDFLCLGSFPLNITNFPLAKYKNFPKEVYNILAQFIPKSHFVELTLECLNDLNFIPKQDFFLRLFILNWNITELPTTLVQAALRQIWKDYQCDRLTSGVLQLSDNTHLIIDETCLTSGQVTPCGKQNYEAITKLVENQKVAYDFQFHRMEFETDIPVLIFSDAKSFIPHVTQIPLKVDKETENLYPQVVEAARQYLMDEHRLNNIRQYLNLLRHSIFEFNDQITEIIQEDFVKMRLTNKSFTGDHLHTLMVLARLMALSHGKNTLTVEIWRKTFELEAERMSRLPKQNDQR